MAVPTTLLCRLDLIGSLIVLSIASLNVGLRGSVSPALVALALSEAIDLTSFLNYAVKVRGGRVHRARDRCAQRTGCGTPHTTVPVAPWPRGPVAPWPRGVSVKLHGKVMQPYSAHCRTEIRH